MKGFLWGICYRHDSYALRVRELIVHKAVHNSDCVPRADEVGDTLDVAGIVEVTAGVLVTGTVLVTANIVPKAQDTMCFYNTLRRTDICLSLAVSPDQNSSDLATFPDSLELQSICWPLNIMASPPCRQASCLMLQPSHEHCIGK